MKLLVKHKKGRFRPQLMVTIRIHLFVYWVKLIAFFKGKAPMLRASFIFNNESFYLNLRDKENDWLKAVGTKSGATTKKNHESIAVYRFKHGEFETAKYTRRKTHISTTYPVKGNRSEHTIMLKYRFAVGPWAGGTYPPDSDFQYTLMLKRL